MTFIRFYNPVSPYRDENANEAFEKIMRHFTDRPQTGSVPASNISENEKEYRIEMALPGVEKKNINISLENGFLKISVEKPEESENPENYRRYEFNYAGAERTFSTGDKIDTENISARYENGILRVHLPKKEAFVKKAAQSISVE